MKSDRYFIAKGGRKTAVAIARVFNKKGGIVVNEKNYTDYFKISGNQMRVMEPIESISLVDKISASIKVSGGGLNAQAEAVRNAIARALVKLNPVFRRNLKQAGFLTRDSRMVERKKYGLKKARRAPQWAKR
ncbi:MAG: 30S ribosomal protein S9 [Patescibacteria group bacterium]